MNKAAYLKYLVELHNLKKDKIVEILSYYHFKVQPNYISSWLSETGPRKISTPALRVLQLSCHIHALTGKWPEPDNRGMPGNASSGK